MSDVIKKFQLIKKDNFANIDEYENEVLKLAISIEQSISNKINEGKINDNWTIKFKTKDVEKWKKFLAYLENYTNREIQKYLSLTFNSWISGQKDNFLFDLANLNEEKFHNTEELKKNLNYKKNTISKNIMNLDRLLENLNNTPMSNLDKFYSGKILYKTTSIKDITKNFRSNTFIFISSLIFGIIIGFIYIIILVKAKKD